MPLTGEYEPSASHWIEKQVDLYETSDGADAKVGEQGERVVVLTTVGRKTGKLRKTPVMRVEHDGAYAVVASMGGADKNPVWYHNVVANPLVELRDGGVVADMHAHVATESEREVWWGRAVAAYPPYAEYQTRTARQIPVIVLEPVG